MTDKTFPLPYSGPKALLLAIHQAPRRVLDPEVAMNIVDVGRVHGVTVTDTELQLPGSSWWRGYFSRPSTIQGARSARESTS